MIDLPQPVPELEEASIHLTLVLVQVNQLVVHVLLQLLQGHADGHKVVHGELALQREARLYKLLPHEASLVERLRASPNDTLGQLLRIDRLQSGADLEQLLLHIDSHQGVPEAPLGDHPALADALPAHELRGLVEELAQQLLREALRGALDDGCGAARGGHGLPVFFFGPLLLIARVHRRWRQHPGLHIVLVRLTRLCTLHLGVQADDLLNQRSKCHIQNDQISDQDVSQEEEHPKASELVANISCDRDPIIERAKLHQREH
mmetsp:Transcript_2791/g.8334  ORF Transcript_2791/g.8334 Transcript_2791/m.8334 type:complete len:262 (-) Transcript_2791:884-1669(-)